MKQFLIKISVYTIFFVLLFTLLTFVVDNGLKKSEYGNLKEWNSLFNGKINSEIIIQGSSRAWTQYSTEIIDSVLNMNSYNLGIDGTPYDFQYVRFELLMKYNRKPKIIIQNVDFNNMGRNHLVYQKYQYLPFLPNIHFKEVLFLNNFSRFDYYLFFTKYCGSYKIINIGLSEYFKIKQYENIKYKGYQGQLKSWDEDNFRKVIHNGGIRWNKDIDVQRQFEDFLLRCKKNDIKVLLVHAPVYKYANTITHDFDGMINYYASLAQKHDCFFLDYSKDSISNETKYFYNATHLNKLGSEKFTIKLCEDIKKICY